MADSTIHDVSDTAIWVAHYRALETERADALFKDPLAKKLVGDRGAAIANKMDQTSVYTQQNVVIRTYIIDRLMKDLVVSGIDTIVNLGAGLDTRPYRLELPANIRWIEVDYPHMIEMKTTALRTEKPNIQLERIPLDLADREKRRQLFTRLSQESKAVVILTEGVLPYLSEDDVSKLAEDLTAQKNFRFWITDYMAEETYKYIQDPKRMAHMKNAPFRFFPSDYMQFFETRGWRVDDIQYIQKTATAVGRRVPMPWFAKLMKPFFSKALTERFSKMSGYMLLKRAD